MSLSQLWNTDNLWKLGLILCFVLNTWATANLVGKKEFEELKERTHGIEKLLGEMKVKNEIDIRQDKDIADLQGRVRNAELDIKSIR